MVEEGTLLLKTPQNYPNWLRTEKEYENFVLRLEYRMSGWCETGLFLHAPLYGDLAESGLRIHLRHDRTEEGSRSTGGIYDVAPPLTLANKPINEWNALEVHMDWPVLRVKLNDVLIQDVNLEASDALRGKARRGYIGLDDLNCRIRYRNLQIRELPNKDRKWTSLSNGKDLKGWTSEGKVQWVVEDGKIVGSNGDGSVHRGSRSARSSSKLTPAPPSMPTAACSFDGRARTAGVTRYPDLQSAGRNQPHRQYLWARGRHGGPVPRR